MRKHIVLSFIILISTCIILRFQHPVLIYMREHLRELATRNPIGIFPINRGNIPLNPLEDCLDLLLNQSTAQIPTLTLITELKCTVAWSRMRDFLYREGMQRSRIPFLVFWAGKKSEIIGNQDSSLSIGSTVWSGNASPMPKLVLATPGYVDIPFTKGYVEINGSLAHGWFEKDRYVEDVYLHQKQLHLRFGGDFFINGSFGIHPLCSMGRHFSG